MHSSAACHRPQQSGYSTRTTSTRNAFLVQHQADLYPNGKHVNAPYTHTHIQTHVQHDDDLRCAFTQLARVRVHDALCRGRSTLLVTGTSVPATRAPAMPRPVPPVALSQEEETALIRFLRHRRGELDPCLVDLLAKLEARAQDSDQDASTSVAPPDGGTVSITRRLLSRWIER